MKPPKRTTTAKEEDVQSPPSMLQWWRRWTVLVAAIWIQAFTGTNFDFSAYSSDMKSSMGVSQSRLNYMAVASDLGKALGWSSGFAVAYFPVSAVLFSAAAMGLVGYGVQWLSIAADVIDLPYSLVLVCCSLAGLSICWFNTVCFVLCVRHFESNHSLALSLVVSFNGISAALYTLGHEVISGKSSASSDIYLLLNSLIPLFVSLLALWPVLTNPNSSESHANRTRDETRIFIVFNVLALITCFYLLLPSSDTYLASSPLWHFLGAICLLLFPLCVPFLDYIYRALHSCFQYHSSGYAVVNIEEPKIPKSGRLDHEEIKSYDECHKVGRLGDEHSLGMLVRSLEFWLYYLAYFCGGTIGLVYSNNLGQIAQSLGQSSSNAKSLVTLFSAFSFLGRLLSSAPDFTRKKLDYLTRTGWFTISLLPTPLAFFILAYSSKTALLQVATALIGLSSGFVFAAAVSVTSDLFGRNSVGVNQNILITNIPIGSLFYGYMAGSVYDKHATPSVVSDTLVCVGRRCYFATFLFWGCLSVVGLVCSLILFIRTRPVYHRNTLNPYEQAITIIGRTLAAFDEDNLIPCFGFGDASTHDQDVFNFYPEGRSCNGFEQVLARYRDIVPHLKLAGPTSFAPIIEMAMTVVEQSSGQYHVLVIIADGQVTRSVDTEHGQLSPQEQKTVDAIVKASALPLSIVLVGVGDGPWDMMQEFDDNIPSRAFDNFQFVNFTEIMSKNKEQSRKETEFALSALMEIPPQYKATIELGLLGRRNGNIPERIPLPPPVQGGSTFFNPSKASPAPSFEPSVPTYPMESKDVDDNQVK
ncbi:hypothetical protein F2Q70_00024140 [Brassica cretica]|uniref:VWFA domain-containing protein n=1 Tax=Brassica cretica TaxID=69181 RepID=A0A8S9HIH1_BRACR|nr:hypothetical protein F2Q70_00024140 [Brassica cretica]KAF2557783.1 hypothetical protein F2Q68_00018469 [Brassica cretica]